MNRLDQPRTGMRSWLTPELVGIVLAIAIYGFIILVGVSAYLFLIQTRLRRYQF